MFRQWDGQFIQLAAEDERKYRSAFIIVQIILQQQLIPLDFDNKDPNKKITFEQVKERADHYDLPVFFAYDTLSSTNHDKFRVVFLNDAPITDRRVAEAVQMAMGEMFPEADSSCYKDVSKLYFGGKGSRIILPNLLKKQV